MPFRFDHVTSAVSVLKDDGIVVHVVNDSAAASDAQIVIYQNTGAGAQIAVDSGVVSVTPTWTWGIAFTIQTSGEYWLRVRAANDFLVPKASFERFQGGVWLPVVAYRPGDFAIFQLRPRKRLW